MQKCINTCEDFTFSSCLRCNCISCSPSKRGWGGLGEQNFYNGIGLFPFFSSSAASRGRLASWWCQQPGQGVFFSHTASLHIKEKQQAVQTGSFRAHKVKFTAATPAATCWRGGRRCDSSPTGSFCFKSFFLFIYLFYLSDVGLDSI